MIQVTAGELMHAHRMKRRKETRVNKTRKKTTSNRHELERNDTRFNTAKSLFQCQPYYMGYGGKGWRPIRITRGQKHQEKGLEALECEQKQDRVC